MSMKTLRVGLFWHSHNSANLGVGALTVSNMLIANEVAADLGAQCDFVVAGVRENGETYVSGDNVRFETIDRNYVSSPNAMWKTVGNLDVVLDITGGDSFTDIYGPKRYIFQSLTKACAITRGVPLILSPQTIGPFNAAWSQTAARWIMRKANLVIARDHASYLRGQSFEPRTNLRESIDVAFALPFEPAQRLENGKIRIGLNVSGLLWSERKENDRFGLDFSYTALTRKILDYFTAMPDVEIHLIPHVHAPHLSYENDCIAHEALAKLYPNVICVPQFHSPSAAKSYISGMDFFMGARMHACIAAYSSGTPLVPISYSPKFEGLFSTLNYPWIVPVNGADTDSAFEIIKKGFSERKSMPAAIAQSAEKIAHLQNNYKSYLREIFQKILIGK